MQIGKRAAAPAAAASASFSIDVFEARCDVTSRGRWTAAFRSAAVWVQNSNCDIV